MLQHYHYTLISAAVRAERNIIAHSARQADQIAARMLPQTTGPFATICKPVTERTTA